ncbi:MAG TPA: GNAT family N-acetyltransferase [archaeon]|nr:GNAT family N-acetyltransferase [archaeon]
MKTTHVPGIAVRYLRRTNLYRIRDFQAPKLPKFPESELLKNRGYEMYYDAESFKNDIESAIRKNRPENNPMEGYAIATNEKGEIIGFALTGGVIAFAKIEGRYRRIPDVHYVYCHPDYRRQGIGTALVEKLLQHHTFLEISGASYLGEKFTKKLLKLYGHAEDEKVIRAPKKVSKKHSPEKSLNDQQTKLK